jgi:cytochrome subunit of sulfide dehydrogenase
MMKVLQISIAAIAVSCAAMALAPNAVADVERGELITTSCFACHSIDGTGNMPNLVGYPTDLLVSQMKMFKDGSRPGTIMNRIAVGYSDEEIAKMGEHFGTLQ